MGGATMNHTAKAQFGSTSIVPAIGFYFKLMITGMMAPLVNLTCKLVLSTACNELPLLNSTMSTFELLKLLWMSPFLQV